MTLQALEAVSNRLRDKKLPVRKEAASQLAAVFRYAKCKLRGAQCSTGGIGLYITCACASTVHLYTSSCNHERESLACTQTVHDALMVLCRSLNGISDSNASRAW